MRITFLACICVIILSIGLSGCGYSKSALRDDSSGGGSGGGGTPTASIVITLVPPEYLTPQQAPCTVQLSALVKILGFPTSPNLTYVWSFGDGATSNATVATHEYTYSGEFDYSVQVRCEKAVAYQLGKVQILGGNKQPLISSCTASRITANSGDDITFNAVCSDPDGDTLTYAWDFGDGSNSTDAQVVHQFAKDGLYKVYFTVSDTHGAHAVKKMYVAVGPGIHIPPQVTNISWSPSFLDTLTPGIFGVSVNTVDGSVVGYSWDFGDGATATGASPSHLYTISDTYQIQVTVQDSNGLTDTYEKLIYVTPGE